VFDTTLQAFRVAEEVKLPAMLVLDAFFLSHTCEIVDVFDAEKGREYLPPFEAVDYLDPANPKVFGNLTGPDNYYELRHMIHKDLVRSIDVMREADRDFERIYGRSYGLIEEYRMDGAETVLVTSGTITSTARAVIDDRREKGEKIGLLKMRLFRPFPVDDVRRSLEGRKKVAVIDRNIGFSIGGIFAQEIRSAMWNTRTDVPIFSFIAGIGGRDVTPDVISEIIDIADSIDYPDRETYWIGVKDEELQHSRT
jgi:pyruvate/2-oxoacid:ferredoxin oxidoreductase alpha subunit